MIDRKLIKDCSYYTSTEDVCNLIDLVGYVDKEFTDCTIVYTITHDQLRQLVALARVYGAPNISIENG